MSERISDEDFKIIIDYVDALKADGWEEGIGIHEYIEMRDAFVAERQKVKELESELEAVRGLVHGWKREDFGLSDYFRGEVNGRNECADELEAALNKEQTK